MNTTPKSWAIRLSETTSLIPLLWFLGMVALYSRARVHLGYWPQPSINDPKLMPFELHHAALWLALLPVLATLLTSPLSWLVRRRMPAGEIVAFGLGWALILGAFLLPGFRLIEWFLD